MKKNYLFLTFLIFLNVFSFGQHKLEEGSVVSIKGKTYLDEIISKDDNGFYAYCSSVYGAKNKLILKRFNNDLQLEFSKVIKTPKNGSIPTSIKSVIYLNNQLIILVTSHNKKLNRKDLLAYSISPQGEINLNPKILHTINPKKKSNASFQYQVSKKNSTLLIYTKSEGKHSNYKVFDSNLNSIWEKDQIVTNSNNSIYNFLLSRQQIYILDDDGHLFTAIHSSSSYENIKILHYNFKKDKLFKYSIDGQGNKILSTLTYDINEDNKTLLISGFYTDKISDTPTPTFQYHGTYYMSIDYSLTTTNTKPIFSAFDSSILKMINKEEKIPNGLNVSIGKPSQPTLYSEEVIPKKNGGVTLVSQKVAWKIKTYTNSSTGVTSFNYKFYLYDIIVIDIESDGNINWTKVIPKKHTITRSSPSFFNSFITFRNSKTNDLYFISNDYKKYGTDLNPREKFPIKSPNISSTIVKIKKDGAIQKNYLYPEGKKSNAYISTEYLFKTSQNSLIILKKQGRKRNFLKLTF